LLRIAGALLRPHPEEKRRTEGTPLGLPAHGAAPPLPLLARSRRHPSGSPRMGLRPRYPCVPGRGDTPRAPCGWGFGSLRMQLRPCGPACPVEEAALGLPRMALRAPQDAAAPLRPCLPCRGDSPRAPADGRSRASGCSFAPAAPACPVAGRRPGRGPSSASGCSFAPASPCMDDAVYGKRLIVGEDGCSKAWALRFFVRASPRHDDSVRRPERAAGEGPETVVPGKAAMP
jgi:hypothetical protein